MATNVFKKTGYALTGGGLNFSPADATTYYFGSTPGSTPVATDGNARIPIPRAGTITYAAVFVVNAGTIGSAEQSTISIRKNSTTDTTISTTVQTDTTNLVANSSLNISVVAGDFVEIKWVTPTWATNPTNVRLGVTVFVQT